MAEEGSHNEEQIITIKSFHKEVETLELVFQRMLKAVQESDMSDAEVSLQHLLLLDAGADEALVGMLIIYPVHPVYLYKTLQRDR